MTKNYLIIPRRFRPQTFKGVVGQEAIVTTLKNALRHERFAHAYLFCGSRGTGKTSLARLFAKALNCQKLTESQEPCNECPSCIEMNQGRSLDVLEIDGASNRGIDDIREINETVGYAPASGKYKIYIIDEVHMLTKEAFNALLKTLEEPPPKIKFFFATTEPHKIPPTITSRCQRFDLARISEEDCVHKLEKIAQELQISVQSEALFIIAKHAEGSLRDAESLLDQLICYAEGPITEKMLVSHLGLMPRESFFLLDQAIAKGDLSHAFSLAQELFNSGKDLSCFYEGLLDHFRLILLILLKQKLPPLSREEQQSYLSSAKLYSQEQCTYILDFLMHEWQHLSKTPLKKVTLEMILLHLLRSKNRVSLEALVKRLSELEKSSSVQEIALPEIPAVEEKNSVDVKEPVVFLESPSPLPFERKVEEKAVPLEKILEKKIEETAPLQPLAVKDSEKEAPQIVSEPVKSKEQPVEPKSDSLGGANKAKYETLLRFAAVELEGNVKMKG
jgi:DNA polymerase-3 subunit gamma/tau